MMIIIKILLIWLGLGGLAYLTFELTGINQLNKGEHFKVFMICCIGGPFSWVAPLIYGHRENTKEEK